jgi:hypothetical protein
MSGYRVQLADIWYQNLQTAEQGLLQQATIYIHNLSRQTMSRKRLRNMLLTQKETVQ